MSWTSRPLDPRFVASRTSLQDRYTAVSRLPDASRLAYLRGRESVVPENQIRDLWATAMENPVFEGESSNNIYIHVPFCKSICNFCNYERLRPSSPQLLEAWLARVIRSIETIGEAVSGVEWGSVYVGGGTPSTLPAGMLRRLFDGLNTHLTVREDAHRAFEFDPQVMSASRVAVLAEYGFSHFSFGIQALDPAVNKAHNRGPQDRSTVSKRFEELYSYGLYDVAVDFLLGLAGTTPESIIADIAWVLETYKPGHVDVFQIAPTPEYVDIHFSGELDRFWAHLEPFQTHAIPALKELADAHGYAVNIEGGHGYTLRRTHLPEGFKQIQRPCDSYTQLVSEAGRPMHLLGFGPSSRSQIFGYAAYQGRGPSDPLSDAPFHYAGHKINLDDEIRTYLVHRLRDRNSVDRERFETIFGNDITEAIPVAMSAWEDQGLLEVDDTTVRLSEDTRKGRMSTLLWLVPAPHLEHEIARRRHLDLSPDGVRRLVGELEEGRLLHGNHTFGGLDEDGRVLILTPDRVCMRFRVAPSLDDDDQVRLVLETRPPADSEAKRALIKAMAAVRGVIRASAAQ